GHVVAHSGDAFICLPTRAPPHRSRVAACSRARRRSRPTPAPRDLNGPQARVLGSGCPLCARARTSTFGCTRGRSEAARRSLQAPASQQRHRLRTRSENPSRRTQRSRTALSKLIALFTFLTTKKSRRSRRPPRTEARVTD